MAPRPGQRAVRLLRPARAGLLKPRLRLRRLGFLGPAPEGRSGAEDGGAVDALAISLGLTAAPVVTIPARQARAFRVIDNRTSELTSWDTDLLPDALSGLNDLDIFSFDDVLPLAATAGKTDPDDIPETPKNPVSRVGDIWTLGKHRLRCGDATKPEHVERLLDGAKPDLMVTDPPYGVNYDSSWRYRSGISSKDGAFGKSTNDDRCDWTDAYALFPGSIAYAWMSSLALPVAARGLDACGFIRRSLIIWDKGHIVPSRRSLQLETRVVLVRRQEGRESQLAGRAQSLDPLGDRQPQEI